MFRVSHGSLRPGTSAQHSTARQRYWASPALHEITSGHKKGAPQRNQGRAGGRLVFRMVSGKNILLGHKTETFDGVLWHKLGVGRNKF